MAEILIYGDIDDFWGDVSPRDIVQQVAAVADDEPINARINSFGGDVFGGIAIFNALANHRGGVTTQIDGIAASAASIIAMAGDKRLMAEGSQLMIHNAWTATIGNRLDHGRTVDLLGGIDDNLVGIYQRASGQHTEELKQMMNDETWMSAEEAIERGFATGELPGKKAKAETPSKVVADARSGEPRRVAAAQAELRRRQVADLRARAQRRA